MSLPTKIALLGSTGSIGRQTLQVVADNAERFQICALVAGQNIALLAEQARLFNPARVVVADESKYAALKEALGELKTEVLAGAAAVIEAASMKEADVVVSALVGFAGLAPTYAAVAAGKTVALANKETLVVAGEIIARAVVEHNARLLPIDSEHSALFQCLQGEDRNHVERMILTASGGPFLGFSAEALRNVKPNEALKHPNWSMGDKITIDSATLVNKGLEVIEAFYLFNLPLDKISVVVHPQSIVHSLVEFCDGSLKAQLGTPDMRTPIQYALTYPERLPNNYPRFHFSDYPSLTFEALDQTIFEGVELARIAVRLGGNAPCVLNAANETAVARFLRNEIAFLDIYRYIETALEKAPFIASPNLEDLVETDRLVRALSY